MGAEAPGLDSLVFALEDYDVAFFFGVFPAVASFRVDEDLGVYWMGFLGLVYRPWYKETGCDGGEGGGDITFKLQERIFPFVHGEKYHDWWLG